jgi:ATP-dependent RNA helicase DDX46/PRP5
VACTSFVLFPKILVDSIQIAQVEQAVREIKRLLYEASAAALQQEMRNPTAPGRYSVV